MKEYTELEIKNESCILEYNNYVKKGTEIVEFLAVQNKKNLFELKEKERIVSDLIREKGVKEEKIKKLKKKLSILESEKIINQLKMLYVLQEFDNIQSILDEALELIALKEDQFSKSDKLFIFFLCYKNDCLLDLFEYDELIRKNYENDKHKLMTIIKFLKNNFTNLNEIEIYKKYLKDNEVIISDFENSLNIRISQDILSEINKKIEFMKLQRDNFNESNDTYEKCNEKTVKEKYKDGISADEHIRINANKINKLKEKFLEENNSEFRNAILTNKVYNGDSKLIEEILNGHICDEFIEINDANTLLIISFFYGFYNELINKFDIFKKIFSSKNEIGNLIRTLDIEKGITEGTRITQAISELVNDKLISDADIDSIIYGKILYLIDIYSYKVFNKYVVSYENINRCIYDKAEMIMKRGYHKLRKNNQVKYLLANEKCCEKCGAIYITEKRFNKINRKSNGFNLEESKIDVLSKESKRGYNDNENLYENLTGIAKLEQAQVKNEDFYDNNLSDESIIKKLGYSTALGRELRWNILNNRVIPKVGKTKVINHIKFLIRMNKNRSVMKNAVREWEYDLEKLLKIK